MAEERLNWFVIVEYNKDNIICLTDWMRWTMRAVEVIEKVRDHKELTKEEIIFFVNGITDGSIPDYQVSAWAMAVLLNGLSARETTELTLAMANSGERIDLSKIVTIAVDKHSTGGVGDKTTLVVEPVVAACGLPVGKMSGRGLGFSGVLSINWSPFRVFEPILRKMNLSHN